MYFKIMVLTLILFSLFGCNLREDDNLPSGVSPFNLLDEAIYIVGEGLYSTSKDNVKILVSQEESNGFDFVSNSYDFVQSSLNYNIRFVDDNEEIIEVEDLLPLLAIPSEPFSYLGLKYQGDYERFYPYPNTDSINSYGAYYENDFCYFFLSNNGNYQTYTESQSHSTITLEIDPSQYDDVNLSLYQAQFILPRDLLPLGVTRVSLEKMQSPQLAEYDLTLLALPVMFNLVQNNPDAERYPILYLPLPPGTDMTEVAVRQVLPNHDVVIFHYSETLETHDQFTFYGNSIIILVNNQGKFIVN